MNRQEFDALMALRDELAVELELVSAAPLQALRDAAAALETIQGMVVEEEVDDCRPRRGRRAGPGARACPK